MYNMTSLVRGSNDQERNWILISGRPTAAPHSLYNITKQLYSQLYKRMCVLWHWT